MPRFKATPQFQKVYLESDSASDDDDDVKPSPETDHTCQTADEEQQKKLALERLSTTAREFLAKLAAGANTVNGTDNFPTALLLVQAAVLASMSTGPCLPLPSSTHPPIAPLGLSMPSVPTIKPEPVIDKPVAKRTFPYTKSQDPLLKPSCAAKKIIVTPSHNVSNGVKPTRRCTTQTPEAPKQTSCNKPTLVKSEPKVIPRNPTVSVSKVAPKRSDSLDAKTLIPVVETKIGIGPIPLSVPEESTSLTKSRSLSKQRAREMVPCSKCNKLMKRGSLREHMDMHNNNGKFPCSTCTKTFSRASALEKHLRTHTGERPFQCEQCPKAYRQRVHLNEHMRSHTGIRPYVCRLCGFSLASKSLLNRHLGTHGVRMKLLDAPDLWFKSSAPKEDVLQLAAEVGRVLSVIKPQEENIKECPKSLDLPLLQKVDKKEEEDEASTLPKDLACSGRKYLCSSCPAGFPTVQALRSHRWTTHGVQHPHKCPECEESFSSIKGRLNHLRDKHPKTCPICSEVMPQRRPCFLEAHMRAFHMQKSPDKLSPPTSPIETVRHLRSAVKRTNGMESTAEALKWKRFRPGDTESTSEEEEEEESDYSEESEESNEVKPLRIKDTYPVDSLSPIHNTTDTVKASDDTCETETLVDAAGDDSLPCLIPESMGLISAKSLDVSQTNLSINAPDVTPFVDTITEPHRSVDPKPSEPPFRFDSPIACSQSSAGSKSIDHPAEPVAILSEH